MKMIKWENPVLVPLTNETGVRGLCNPGSGPKSETDFAHHRDIQARCVHPTGHFVEFGVEEIEQSIPKRFEQQVARYPDCLAIRDGNQQITYDELNRAANRVARAILAQRGEGEEPIALMLEHGTSILVGILGVLKAGKIYTPLDPSFPRNRLKYILENSQAHCIVTDSQNCNLTGELSGLQIQTIKVDKLNPNLSTGNPDLSISRVCCVLYSLQAYGVAPSCISIWRSDSGGIPVHHPHLLRSGNS